MALRIRLTYPQRLFVWLLGYSLLLIGVFVAFQYSREKDFKAGEINAQLQLVNTYIDTELQRGRSVSEIRLDEFHPFDDLRLSVISSDGQVVYDNSLDSLPRSNHLDRREIQQALRYGTGFSQRRHSTSTGNTYFYAAHRGADGCIIRTAVPYSVSLTDLLRADYGFIWVMAVIAIAVCTLGYFATRRVGDHIVRLKQFADSVEQGALISDNEPFPHDELGQISNNIVRLYARLQRANCERDAQHRAAIYQQQEKERIKKQLTNNINHELKTPVASVRICVETMLSHPEMEPERRHDFLRRCLADTDRLQRLLGDVSLITRMDEAPGSIAHEPVDLTALIGEVVSAHQPLADASRFVIDNSITSTIMVNGNASLLEAIFSNLIDNAMAYSGGDRLRIWLADISGGKAEIGVADNGHGVAPEHLPHLFERFYRIDKGRSRAAGGTGLGLSIVKNAVLIHGGSVSVSMPRQGGLVFRIILPGFIKN